jgi:hypothetical protein
MPACILTVAEITHLTDDFKRYSVRAAELLKQFGGEYQKNLKPLRAGSGIYEIGAWEVP